MIMNSPTMNTITDKNVVGRPLFNDEVAGEPIICDASTKESKGNTGPKKKIKVAILQLQQFREFLRSVRCGTLMERSKFICGAVLRIEREKPLTLARSLLMIGWENPIEVT